MGDGENGVVSAQVMKDVMDKFLLLVQENNKNYSAMVAAVETLAGNQMVLSDKVEVLVRTIDDEQLGDIVAQTAEETFKALENFKASVKQCAINDLDFMVDVSKHLAYENKPKDVADKFMSHVGMDYLPGDVRKNFYAFIKFVGLIRRRIIVIAFFLGVLFAPVYISSGRDVLKYIFKILMKG